MMKNAKILIIALNGIGNLILATPMIASLKQSFPHARITVLALKDSASVVEGNHLIKKTIVYPAEKSLFRRIAFLLALRGEKYDVSVYPYPNTNIMSALIGFIIGAKTRVNFTCKLFCFELGFLDTMIVPVDFDKHDVDKNLDLAFALGAKKTTKKMFIQIRESDRNGAKKLLSGRLGRNDLLVAMHIGSKESARIWPTENFAEVADELCKNPRVKVVLIGGGNEAQMVGRFPQFKNSSIINLINKTAIPESAAILEKCKLIIANDSGPVHMASAVGTLALVIYLGPHIRRTAPYGKQHVVFVEKKDCTYKDENQNHIYVEKVTPNMIIKKANELIGMR
jgi:heptosyltransferase II